MKYTRIVSLLFLALGLLPACQPKASDATQAMLAAAEDKLALGEELFVQHHCATCHLRNMVEDLTGPALRGVTERWSDYPREDLYRFIRESQAMIIDGHPKALEQWEAWKPRVMNNHTLTDEEIEALLAYIERE